MVKTREEEEERGSSADWEEISKTQEGQRRCCHDVVVNEICDHR